MKRKQLKIIFFSVLMVAATPRAMSNFDGYADALYHKAETEWLHFLLTFAQAEATDTNPATPNQAKEESPCPLSATNVVQPVNAKPTTAERKNSRSLRSRVRSSDVELAIKPSATSEVAKETAGGDMQMDSVARRHANRIITMLDNPAIIERNGRSKTEFLRVLIRSMKLGDGKAVRALEKELTSVDRTKSPPFASVPVSFDWPSDQSPESQTDVAAETTIVDHNLSDDHTLDAR